jgi:hypothetical protein
VDAARAAPVDELDGRDAPHRLHDRTPPLGQLSRGGGLQAADHRPLQPRSGIVPQPGDVALVAHQAHELEAGPPDHIAGNRDHLVGSAQRRSLRADAQAPAGQGVAEVHLDADADGAAGGAARRVDQVEVIGGVDHHYGPIRSLEAAELPHGGAVGRGVGDEQVLEAMLVEPERLRQREGHEAAVTRVALQDHAQERPAPDRLARDPQPCALGAPQHVGGVPPQGVHVHQGERRVQRGGGGLVARVELRGRRGHETMIPHRPSPGGPGH